MSGKNVAGIPEKKKLFAIPKKLRIFARFKKPQRFFGAMGCLKKSTE